MNSIKSHLRHKLNKVVCGELGGAEEELKWKKIATRQEKEIANLQNKLKELEECDKKRAKEVKNANRQAKRTNMLAKEKLEDAEEVKRGASQKPSCKCGWIVSSHLLWLLISHAPPTQNNHAFLQLRNSNINISICPPNLQLPARGEAKVCKVHAFAIGGIAGISKRN